MEHTGRIRKNFNRDFLFLLGDHDGAEREDFDDSAWEIAHLPHCFSTPFWGGGAAFYVGYGWYRKRFDIVPEWNNKRVFLEFEGAFQDAEVFVNGEAVGRHQGGYTGFRLELTSALRMGANTLSIRLNNLWDAEIAPRAGEHQFAGGIYRNVYLVVLDSVHIPYCGLSVTTHEVSADAATVRARTFVTNQSQHNAICRAAHRLIDPAGREVVTMKSERLVGCGETTVFDETSVSIPNPQLWSPTNPTLYTLETQVYADGVLVDTQKTSVGFRWFAFMAYDGFYLNGERLHLEGVNIHQDHAGWCNAVTDAGVRRDVMMVKEAGFNFIRGSHYPQHPALYQACDELGILLWSEFCYWGTGGDRNEGFWSASAYPPDSCHWAGFEASCLQGLEEMILQQRNHPSVFVWSMCNEVFFCNGHVMAEAKGLLTRMVERTHQLDPTRPAAIGGSQRGEVDVLGDLAGYNGDGARLFRNPGFPNLVAEYGSCVEDRPGEFRSLWTDGVEIEEPWRAGRAVWCMFDHGSIAGVFGCMGLVDYFRLPKRSWYWYRQALTDTPPPAWPMPNTPAQLRLETDKTQIGSDGTDDCHIIVTVLDAQGQQTSLSPSVTLMVVSGPGEFPTGPEIPFDPDTPIAIRDGQAAIEFRSYYAGTTVIRASSEGLADAELTIETMGDVPFDAASIKRRPVVLNGPATPRSIAPENVGLGVSLTLSRPTRASSEKPFFPASRANDGDLGTLWLADVEADDVWWQVDMERYHTVSRVHLRFDLAKNYRYRIDISDDAKLWRSVIDRSETNCTAQTREELLPAESHGRYLRMTFRGERGVLASLRRFDAYPAALTLS